MNKKRMLSLFLLLGAAILVHGNSKRSYFGRITGIFKQGNSVRINYTNSPGHTEVWLGTTNALQHTNTLWTLIATNTQTTQQISNTFVVSLPPEVNGRFFRLLAPSQSIGQAPSLSNSNTARAAQE